MHVLILFRLTSTCSENCAIPLLVFIYKLSSYLFKLHHSYFSHSNLIYLNKTRLHFLSQSHLIITVLPTLSGCAFSKALSALLPLIIHNRLRCSYSKQNWYGCFSPQIAVLMIDIIEVLILFPTQNKHSSTRQQRESECPPQPLIPSQFHVACIQATLGNIIILQVGGTFTFAQGSTAAGPKSQKPPLQHIDL